MILSDIYYGRLQIQKVYQNGFIIWEGGKPAIRLELYGLSEIITEATGVGHLLTNICLYGVSENESYSDGVMRCFVLLPTEGLSETESYSNLLGRALPAIRADGIAETITDGNVKGRACSAGIIETAEGIMTDADAKGRAFWLRVAEGLSEDIPHAFGRSYAVRIIVTHGRASTIAQAYGKGYASRIIPSAGLSATEITEADGIARALSILKAKGAVAGFDNDGTAKGRVFPFIQSAGRGSVRTYGHGTFDQYPIYRMTGVSEIDSDSNSIVRSLKGDIGRLISETGCGATATAMTYYLPILKDSTLYIRQAYSATLNDGILEVS